MRRSIYSLVERLAGKVGFEGPIYEFGSFQVQGQEARSDLRKLFPGKEYIGCDIRQGPGVDRIMDLHKIDLPEASVGTVLLLDVIEHVEHCERAIGEIFRILKPGGTVIVASVMYFPIHDHPSDYWRFTPAGLRSLLAQFPVKIVESVGLPTFPSTVLGIALKGDVPKSRVDAISNETLLWKKNIANWWQELVSALIPVFAFTFLYPLYRSIETRLRKWK